MMEEKDRIYLSSPAEPFRFDDKVARVFPDMISRSVPAYEQILEGIGIITRRYVQAHSNCYDLGCSLGAATLAMRRNIIVPGVKIIALDSSPSMTGRCRQIMDEDSSITPVEVLTQDMNTYELENASIIVLNFTMQFLDPVLRGDFTRRLYRALRPGGVLIISEKVRFGEQEKQEVMTELHEDFKRKNEYSDLEIARKRQALENVLLPWTEEEYLQVLAEAGFKTPMKWIAYFQFMSFLARKDEGSRSRGD